MAMGKLLQQLTKQSSLNEQTSFISTLPDDVLFEIFKLCTAETRSTFQSTVPPAFLLAQVCSHWRSIAYNLPSLWTTLSVRRTDLNKLARDMLAQSLKRARALPIDFQLAMMNSDWASIALTDVANRLRVRHPAVTPAFTEQLKKEVKQLTKIAPANPPRRFLCDLLRPVASNITRLALTEVLIKSLVALPQKSFPNLERLVLGISTHQEWDKFPWKKYGEIKAFAHSPKLTHVALRRWYRSEARGQHIHLPWEQLTHVVDYWASQSEPADHLFLEKLPKCAKNLKHLTVFLGRNDMMGSLSAAWMPLQGNRISLPEVECINVDSPVTGYPGFLEFFDFPNLKRLRLARVDLTGTATWLRGSLDNPGRFAHLEHLALLNIFWFSTATIVATLQATPRLTSFEVTLAEEVLMLLTRGRFGDCCKDHVSDKEYDLLPNLEVLTLRYSAEAAKKKKFDRMDMRHLQGSLIRLIESRRVEVGDLILERPSKLPRSMGLKAIHLMWHGYDRPVGLNGKDPVYSMLRAVAVTAGVGMEISVEDMRWPGVIMDSLIRDKDIEGWAGVEDLVYDPPGGPQELEPPAAVRDSA